MSWTRAVPKDHRHREGASPGGYRGTERESRTACNGPRRPVGAFTGPSRASGQPFGRRLLRRDAERLGGSRDVFALLVDLALELGRAAKVKQLTGQVHPLDNNGSSPRPRAHRLRLRRSISPPSL
jgi:hypothetical protein